MIRRSRLHFFRDEEDVAVHQIPEGELVCLEADAYGVIASIRTSDPELMRSISVIARWTHKDLPEDGEAPGARDGWLGQCRLGSTNLHLYEVDPSQEAVVVAKTRVAKHIEEVQEEKERILAFKKSEDDALTEFLTCAHQTESSAEKLDQALGKPLQSYTRSPEGLELNFGSCKLFLSAESSYYEELQLSIRSL